MLYYANTDKTKLVPGDSPEAHWTINPDSPGEFEGLLREAQAAEQAKAQEQQAKAQKPAEDKAARAPERR